MSRRLLHLSLVTLFTLVSSAHAQSATGYDVHYYNAEVQLDRKADSLAGTVVMMATSTTPLTTILQHAKYLTLEQVFVDESPATIQWLDTAMGSYNVLPSKTIDQGKSFTVRTVYHGHGLPEQNSAKWGGVTDDDSMMFAMGVGFAVPYTSCTRHWLPCYDLPDDKADSVDLTFTTPLEDIVASNGILVSMNVKTGMRQSHWHVSHPIASYLLTFADGPYTEATISNPLHIPFQVFALERDSAQASQHMNVRALRALSYYDSLFAPYPFEKVGYVVTPIGSMEHQTMISLDKKAMDTLFTNTTPVHELAHMWWGDWVTCRTFDDAWLNEGFATYCESLILQRFHGQQEYLNRQRANIIGAKRNPQYPLFGAATATNHTNNYPYTTIYQKGAAVLGMLREYLGDSLFFYGLREYGKQHAYSTATSQDLQQDMEQSTAHDLNWFFKEWVYGTGYPQLSVVWSPSSSGATLTFKQTANAKQPSYYRVPLPVLGKTNSGLSRRVTVLMDSLATCTASADFGFKPDTLIIDPDGLILKKVISVLADVANPSKDESKPLSLNVFPNPTHRHVIHVRIVATTTLSSVDVLLFDTAGRLQQSSRIIGNSRSIEHEVSLSGLTAGSYTLVVHTANGQETAQQITVEP